MSVLRQLNILGQQRLDVPHVRSIDSSVAGDFDTVVGRVEAGTQPLVIQGFTLANASTGTAATSVQLATAGGIFYNINASESGSFLWVPSNRAVEVLNPATNSRVTGAFTASQTNYIGLDLVRSADETTTDLVQFLDPDTLLEQPKDIPLARTLDYVIVISTTPFSATPNLVPIAKIVTDSSNNVSTVQDARNLFFRLGSGGDFPDIVSAYPWPQGRLEGVTAFTGGDKGIPSLKDWADAVMTRIWESGGGEHWFSATADRNVTMVGQGTQLSNGEYFAWDGTNLTWATIRFIFDNSTGYYNDVTQQLTSSPGLTNLADGECLYVDLDRTQNRTGGTSLTAAKAALVTLGPGSPSGARQVMAWRSGANVFSKFSRWPVGTTFQPATTTALGIVELSRASATPSTPVVISDGGGSVTAPAASNLFGFQATGNNTGPGIIGNGGGGGMQNSDGVQGNGLVGVHGFGATGNSPGVQGEGGAFTAGTIGLGFGSSVSGALNAMGVWGIGGDSTGSGGGPGPGVYGIGGGTHVGVLGIGHGGSVPSFQVQSGVVGQGTGTGFGGHFFGVSGSSPTTGLVGVGGALTAAGVSGVGVIGRGGTTSTGVAWNGGDGVQGYGAAAGSSSAGSGNGGTFVAGNATGAANGGFGVYGAGPASSATAAAGSQFGVVGIGSSGNVSTPAAPAWTGVVGAGYSNAPGVYGQGGTSASGIIGIGGTGNTSGVAGTGGSGNGIGVLGTGTGTATGVRGVGGTGGGDGVTGVGQAGGNGGTFTGQGVGNGVNATGGATGIGVNGTGGASGGIGVQGTGTGTGLGVYGVAGGSGLAGVRGDASNTSGGSAGVLGNGGTVGGYGVYGSGTVSYPGVFGIGGSTGPGGQFSSNGNTSNEVTVSTATGAALNVPILTSDPASPVAGDLWIRNTSGTYTLKLYTGSATKTLTFS